MKSWIEYESVTCENKDDTENCKGSFITGIVRWNNFVNFIILISDYVFLHMCQRKSAGGSRRLNLHATEDEKKQFNQTLQINAKALSIFLY